MRNTPSIPWFVPTPSILLLLLLLTGLSLCLAGCGSSSDDDPEEPTSNVSLLVSRGRLLALTGAASFRADVLLETSSGTALVWDGVSGDLLQILADGSTFLITDAEAFEDVTGEPVVLGPMHEVRAGTLAGSFLSADAATGNMIRIDPLGVPRLFSSAAQILLATGAGTFRMVLPKGLLNNQFVAQDHVSIHILRFDPAGNASIFVQNSIFAAIAGVPVADARVVGWAQGRTTGNLFARFDTTDSIVKMTISAQLTRHVSGTELAVLFPDIADLRILDMETAMDSDALLILIGDGDRGVGLAAANSIGQPSVYTSREQLEDALGEDVDISDIHILVNSVPVAVDRGTAQVLTFTVDGAPLVVGTLQEVQDAAGTMTPALRLTTGLGNFGALVPDEDSESLLSVQ